MRTWALLFLLAMPAMGAEPRGVLVLKAPGDPRREALLVDALRIYMRDLGRVVRAGGAAPETLDPGDLERIAAEGREADAAQVVWFGDHDGAPVLFALGTGTLELRETPVEDSDPEQSARTLALKLRALVQRQDHTAWATRTPAPSPSPSPVPPSPTPSPVPILPSPSPSPVRSRVVPSQMLPPTRTYVELEAQYGFLIPTNVDWFRHGLTVRIAVPLRSFALFADVAFTTAPSTTVDGHPVSARIWPVAVGAVWRLERPHFRFAVGPRVSLQIVDAEARATNGRIGRATRESAGLGILAQATWRFSRHLWALASFTAEALVPRLVLRAGGAAETDLGWAQLGLSAGLAVPIP